MPDLWPLLTGEPIDGDTVIHRQLRPAGCAVVVDRDDFGTATPAVIGLCDSGGGSAMPLIPVAPHMLSTAGGTEFCCRATSMASAAQSCSTNKSGNASLHVSGRIHLLVSCWLSSMVMSWISWVCSATMLPDVRRIVSLVVCWNA